MNSYGDTTPRAGRAAVQPPAVGAGPSDSPAPERRTTRMVALDHLATGLRAAYHDTPIVTWQQIAQCTLNAAQHASATSAGSAHGGGTLQHRMVLNHDLDRAFMARKNRQPWKTYDGPTLLVAVDDLIAAERTHPT